MSTYEKQQSQTDKYAQTEHLYCDVNGAPEFLAVLLKGGWARKRFTGNTRQSTNLILRSDERNKMKVKLGLSSLERKFWAKMHLMTFCKLLKCNWCLKSPGFKLQS